MNEIILKMPKRKKKVRIVKSKKDLLDFIQKQNQDEIEEKKKQELEKLKTEELKLRELELEKQREKEEAQLQIIETPQDNNEEIVIPPRNELFTEIYSISGGNKPLEISMDKVKEDTLTIDEAMLEVQDAYDRGFNDGKDAANIAYQTEVNKYAEWIRRIDVVIEEIENNYHKEMEKFSDALVKTSILTAKKILENEISNDSKIIISQIKKAIYLLDDNDVIIRIAVHPDDMEILEQSKSSLVSDKSRLNKTKITADSNIEKGGCILTTSTGEIDAKISTQLKNVENLLKNSIEESISTAE